MLPAECVFYSSHTGMSPEFDSMDKIREITRPADCPDKGFLCDLLWSDPAEDTVGFRDGDRGVSYNYGPDVVKEFVQKHDISLIVRGRHPMVSLCNKIIVCQINKFCGRVYTKLRHQCDSERVISWGLCVCASHFL